jgi:hypothetical protein
MTKQPIELITRQQMAKLADVCISKINAAATIESLNFPPERGKKRNEKLYAKDEFLAWLKENPLKDMHITSARFIAATRPQKMDHGLAAAFLRGDFAPAWGRQANLRRLLKARKSQAKSEVVHVKEPPNEREAPRASLAMQTGPERQTLAAMAGRSFY